MSFLLYQLPLASQLTKCQAIGAAFRTRRIRAPSLANFLPSRPALDLPAPASSLCSNTQAGIRPSLCSWRSIGLEWMESRGMLPHFLLHSTHTPPDRRSP